MAFTLQRKTSLRPSKATTLPAVGGTHAQRVLKRISGYIKLDVQLFPWKFHLHYVQRPINGDETGLSVFLLKDQLRTARVLLNILLQC